MPLSRRAGRSRSREKRYPEVILRGRPAVIWFPTEAEFPGHAGDWKLRRLRRDMLTAVRGAGEYVLQDVTALLKQEQFRQRNKVHWECQPPRVTRNTAFQRVCRAGHATGIVYLALEGLEMSSSATRAMPQTTLVKYAARYLRPRRPHLHRWKVDQHV